MTPRAAPRHAAAVLLVCALLGVLLLRQDSIVLAVRRAQDSPALATTTRVECPVGGMAGPCVGRDGACPLVFIHIPKTAGTTVAAALQEWVQAAGPPVKLCVEMGPFPGYEQGHCPKSCASKDITIYSGHQGYGYCAGMATRLQRDAFMFAVLRDPVDRVLSYIDMMLDPTRHFYATGISKVFVMWTQNEAKDVNMLIQRDLASTNTRSNKFIVSQVEQALKKLGSTQASMLCGYNRTWIRDAFSNKELTSCAIRNLRNLDAVGITETLPRFLPVLRVKLGDLIPEHFTKWPTKNSARNNKTRLSPESRAILARFAAVDQAVYDEAKLVARRHEVDCLGN